MGVGKYRRDNTPPPAGPRLKLIRFKANESANVSLFGTMVHGFWCHWGQRTEPCTDPREECAGCKLKLPSRWKGYVHALREDKQEEGFLELTQKNREDLLAHVGPEKLMRGTRIKVLRGKGDKTALRILLLRPFAAEFPGSPLPDELDPEPTLKALFEFAARRHGGKNGEA